MSHTLVIDQGTHASRAIIFSSTGKLITSSEKTIQLNRINRHCIEQDADEILQSVISTVKDVLPKTSVKIQSCAIATQRSTMLAWHKETLHSLHPALSWQDRRSEDDLLQFKNHEPLIRNITGLPLSAHYGAGKFRYLLKQLHTQQDSILLGPLVTYLLTHLTREHLHRVDHSNAHRTLLFDLHSLNWSDELLELFQVNKHYLPDCKPTRYDYGELMDTGIPIRSVSGDQNAALFSQGVIPDDTAIVNLGTGAFILSPTTTLESETGLLQGIARSNQQADYLLEGTVNGAGAAISWAQQHWPVTQLYTQLDNWLQNIDHLPVFINTIGGLGSPWWISGVDPYFINDDDHTLIEQRYVAIIESIIFLIMKNLERLAGHTTIKTLRVSGGLSQLDGLCQKLANLSGCQVERLDDPEATARGA
ncbi:MAG: FGGY family carbohydrate kinase, partial [Gammaproteobacteria bacterium]|nr:FGGY family carbohydrate kinase [Gammaproteobacteria bacterium]